MAKKNLIVTPKGIAVFPSLTIPDTKFDTAGVYKTGLKLSRESAEDLITAIEKGIDQAVVEAQKDPKNKGKKIKRADPPYKMEVDDAGNETGNVIINFKSKASGESKKTPGKVWERKVALYDAKNNKIDPEKVRIYGGSEIRVSFEIGTFYTALVGAGVSLRLEGVKVLRLSEGSGASASALGFEEEEGYSAADEAGEEFNEESGSTSGNNEGAEAQQGDF